MLPSGLFSWLSVLWVGNIATMIPGEKHAAVSRAVQAAFGTTAVEDTQQMTKGLSADLVFRIGVNGSSYLLRIMTRVDERNDPVRIFSAMNAAAAAGLAPGVLYANVEDGVSITDFIEAVPFSKSEAFVRMPGTLRTLHALPAFSKTFNFITMHNAFVWRFRNSEILPPDQIEEAFHQYARISAIYPRVDSDMVSCHNDLKPENILFDGHRVWLIDWQAAFVNDRYFDLAIVANFLANTDAEEKTYLLGYFGQAPDEYQQARWFLMRQVMHFMYAVVFLLLGSARQPIDVSTTVPEFEEFHRRIWAGDATFQDNEMRVTYGRVHWERFLQNVRRECFEQALKIVSDRHKDTGSISRLLPPAP